MLAELRLPFVRLAVLAAPAQLCRYLVSPSYEFPTTFARQTKHLPSRQLLAMLDIALYALCIPKVSELRRNP
jgi:hypothetical protein